MTDDLNKQWLGKAVQHQAGPGVAIVIAVTLCKGRDDSPYIGLHVRGEDWESVWPVAHCVEATPCAA